VLQLTLVGEAVLLPVKVVPGASRTRCLGEWEGRARIAVAAAPEKGKANAALAAYLAKLLSVRRRDVVVVAGHTSPLKTIRIERVSADAVRAALQSDRS
jgi:uncharacterized protein (TIGR00251 family)